MTKQLCFNFGNGMIEEKISENSLYKWCIDNSCTYLLEEWDYEKKKNVNHEYISYWSNRFFY